MYIKGRGNVEEGEMWLNFDFFCNVQQERFFARMVKVYLK